MCPYHRAFTKTPFLWGEYASLESTCVDLNSPDPRGLPLWKRTEYRALSLSLTAPVWTDLEWAEGTVWLRWRTWDRPWKKGNHTPQWRHERERDPMPDRKLIGWEMHFIITRLWDLSKNISQKSHVAKIGYQTPAGFRDRFSWIFLEEAYQICLLGLP